MKEETRKHLLAQIQENFKTFGAGQEVDPINKTALALQDGPLCFAAGVDVADVIELVLRKSRHQKLVDACEVAEEAFRDTAERHGGWDFCKAGDARNTIKAALAPSVLSTSRQ